MPLSRPPSVRWPPLPKEHSAGLKGGLSSTPSWRASSRETTSASRRTQSGELPGYGSIRPSHALGRPSFTFTEDGSTLEPPVRFDTLSVRLWGAQRPAPSLRITDLPRKIHSRPRRMTCGRATWVSSSRRIIGSLSRGIRGGGTPPWALPRPSSPPVPNPPHLWLVSPCFHR